MAVDAPKFRLPSLKALQAFEAAARYQSFAKAAEELGVTPGAVAQQIKNLESWLEFPLFHRESHGVRLTDTAEEILPELCGSFDSLGLAVQRLRQAGEGDHLRIAALPCIAQLWLSPRLMALRTAFPGLRISVTAMEGPPNFRREPYDMALFYLDKPPKNARQTVLAEDHLFPVCHPALAEGSTLSDLLRQQPLLADTVWEEDWRRWLKYAGYGAESLRVGSRFSLYSLALQTALEGGGILIGRETLVSRALERGDLVAPCDLRLPSDRPLSLLLPHRVMPSRKMNAVVEWLKREAA